MPIRRLIQRRLAKPLRESPAVALLGPRQAGKTTLAKGLSSARRGRYYDLELEQDRLRLDLEWDACTQQKRLVVLDEAQAHPEVFPRLRAAIDADRGRTGRFLLLGSVSPALMREVSESLAGRLALVELTPFLWRELESDPQRERLWAVGGYPDGGLLRPSRFPKWQSDYLDLLAQRDLPNWGLSAAPSLTRRLMRMLAAVHGQAWNASAIARSLGIDFKTVNRYVDYLEGAYLLRRLEPLHANIKKRLVKSPKLYWRDSGVLHSLLRLADRRQLLDQAWVGASWEGFVIEQTLGHVAALGIEHDAAFFRTSDGREIDLVLDVGLERFAIEIKLTSHPSPQDMQRLDAMGQWIDASRRILISRTPTPVQTDEKVSCDLPWFLKNLRDLLAPDD
ncbi:MAG: ATP-binding protein [Myxococcota bacterium]